MSSDDLVLSHVDSIIDQGIIRSDYDFQRYRLNASGKLVSDKNFLSRLIRVILDYFFDKTIADTMKVFNIAIKRFKDCQQIADTAGRDNLLDEEQPEKNATFKRVQFLGQFLLSREKKLDRYLKRRSLEKLSDTIYSCPKLYEGLEIEKLDFKTNLQWITPPVINYANISKRETPVKFYTPSADVVNIGDWDLSSFFKEYHPKCEYQKIEDFSEMIEALIASKNKADKDAKDTLINIFHALSDPNISRKLKKRAFREIVRIVNVCKPTWHEVFQKCLNILTGVDRPADQQLLGLLVDTKEDILNEWQQTHLRLYPNWNDQWHGLNHVRVNLGKKYGLRSERGANDPYKDSLFGTRYPLSDNYCEKLIRNEFTANALVTGVQNGYNILGLTKTSTDVQEWLQVQLQKTYEDPSEFILKKLTYTEEMPHTAGKKIEAIQLTEAGTVVALRLLGILS